MIQEDEDRKMQKKHSRTLDGRERSHVDREVLRAMARRARGDWRDDDGVKDVSPLLSSPSLSSSVSDGGDAAERALRERMRVEDAKRRVLADSRNAREDKDDEAPKRTVREEEDGATRAIAAEKLENDLAEVREMNSMVLYGEVMTARDAQVEEKRIERARERETERRLDEDMERARVEAIARAENVEKTRAEEMRRAAETLRGQIAEREIERVKAAERRDRESKRRVEDIQQSLAEMDQASRRKRETAQKLLEEINLSNREQIARKAEVARAEREADECAMRYLAEKAARDAERAERQEEQRRLREVETARLRSMQEKYIDNRADRDAQRARKLQDAYERETRAKEAAERDKRRAMLEDLAAARLAQHEEKLNMRREEKTRECENAQIAQREYLAQLEAERRREEARRADALAHARDLSEQIRRNEIRRRRDAEDAAREAKELKRREAERVSMLERIKAKKLVEMRDAGVPVKYRVELQSR